MNTYDQAADPSRCTAGQPAAPSRRGARRGSSAGSFPAFCATLAGLHSRPSLAELDVIGRFRITPEEWARYFLPHVRFNRERYSRVELTDLPGYPFPHHQVLLLCWQEGQASCIHDHGGSVCLVRILSGTARETLYARTADGRARPVAATLYHAGDLTCRAESDLHRVEAVGGPLVSLHVYPRDLRDMKTYAEIPVE